MGSVDLNETRYVAVVPNATQVSNVSLDEYMMWMRGPKRMSYEVLLPITIVYVIIFVAGVVGNISTVVVISKIPRMHTATNFYLISLAISDLVTLLLGKLLFDFQIIHYTESFKRNSALSNRK